MTRYYDIGNQEFADSNGRFEIHLGGPMDGHTWDLRRIAIARVDDPFASDSGDLIIYSARSEIPPPTEIDIAFDSITTPFGIPLTSRSCIAIQHERFVAVGVFVASQPYVVTGLVIDEDAA